MILLRLSIANKAAKQKYDIEMTVHYYYPCLILEKVR